MDPDMEIIFDYPNLFRVYRSGRIERCSSTTETVPASLDESTGVTSKDVTIDSDKSISARLYLPYLYNKYKKMKLPILVYFHGGAFCVCSAFSPTYHSFVNTLVSKANIIAVSVNYRLATEHLLPTAYEDSWDALKWVFNSNSDAWLSEYGDYERVFIGGDSAGGNITHQMALRAGEFANLCGENRIRIKGMALVHPFFWGREVIKSETTDAKKRAFIENLWGVVNMPGVDIDDPHINPIAKGAPSLGELRCGRAIVCVAGKDWLVERGRAYYEALKESGWKGEVELVESKGEGHCFHLENPGCEEALELMERLVDFFSDNEEGERMKCIRDCCGGLVHVWNSQILPFLQWRSYDLDLIDKLATL